MDVQSRRDRCGLYEFAQFMLDVPEGELTCGAERIHLAPKTFEVLVALVTRPHRLRRHAAIAGIPRDGLSRGLSIHRRGQRPDSGRGDGRRA